MNVRWLGICIGMAAGIGMQAAWGQVSAETPGWFPFVMKGTDMAKDAPADVSFLNEMPAAKRISVQNGRFVDEAGERVRFFGTNVTFSGAFPEKEIAPAIATRLAQLGFNVVRFHHLDARDIWLPGQQGIDPEKLDRIHWFVYQLKQNGIYSNINLHVSRTYPGLRELDLARTFRYGKVLDKYHEPYIELQEAYARDLLAPVNPYTDMPLAADPAVAFVELNNENTLLRFGPEQLQELTAPVLRQSLQKRWTEWLASRFENPKAIETAWNRNVVPLGEEMLRNGDFEEGLQPWVLEGAAPGICEMSQSEAGGGSAHITISEAGKVSWAYQLHQLGIELEEGMSYTITFRGRAVPSRQVSVSLRFAEPPWTILSGRNVVELTDQWQTFTVPCRVYGVEPDVELRLSLNLGDEIGEIWVADASLRSGRQLFSAEGVTSIQDMLLPTVKTPAAGWRDFRRFLIDTEQNYVKRLRTFLREQVGVRSLIVDTQGNYGGYWGLWREASLSDYIDMHAYWQHPRFPGRPWDGNNWFIPNTSMVANENGGVYSRLTAYRIPGMPYSVSEYNHPAPNDHAAELFPMLATFASHQDWDALYQFSYCNNVDSYESGKIGSYFELCHHAGQLVFAPLMAALFRQELLPPAADALNVTVPLGVLDERLATGFASDDVVSRDDLPLSVRFAHRFSVQLKPGEGEVEMPGTDQHETTPEGMLMNGDAIRWTTGERAVYQAVSPAARVIVGKIGGRELELGDVLLTINLPSDTWACAALVAADGKAVAESETLLLAVVTRVENSGMGWNEERTTVLRQWGSEPVVAQAVPFVITGPGKTPTASALNPKGERQSRLAVSGAPGGWRLEVGPDTRTIWYALERD